MENMARPSTSEAASPTSSIAIETAWQASDSSESGSPLPNAVWPIPTIAVLSVRNPLMEPSNGSGARRQVPAAALRGAPPHGLSPLELGRPPLDERGDALGRVLGARDHLDHERLLLEEGGAVDVERAVEQPLGETDRLA